MPFQEKFNVSNFHTLFLQKWVWKTLALCCIGCGEEASRKLLSPTSDQTDIYSAEPTEGLKIWNYVVGKICPLVLIGSTDLPKYGGGGGRQMPPCPHVPPSLLRHILIHLPLLSFRVIKMALGTTSILQCTLYTGTHWSRETMWKATIYKVRIQEIYDLI